MRANLQTMSPTQTQPQERRGHRPSQREDKVRIKNSESPGPQTSSRAISLRPSFSDDDRMDSWKEIAAYLRRTVRTVQRWEKTEGLPVHRHVHDRRSSVYAHRSQLDSWWASEPVSIGQGQPIDSSASVASAPGASLQESVAQVEPLHLDVIPYKLGTSAGSEGKPRQIEIILVGNPTDAGVSMLRLIDIRGDASEWRMELSLKSLIC